MAEFQLQTFVVPQEPVFNHEQLKAEIAATVEQYKTIVYTEDSVKEAKADLAKLRKLKDAINSERIARQKEYEAPFKAFKAKVDDILKVIDEPICIIDKQVKGFEAEQDKQKKEMVAELFVTIGFPEWVSFESCWREDMLKKTMTKTKIKAFFEETRDQILRNVKTLQALPEYSVEALEYYKQNRNIDAALAEVNRLRQYADARKALEEARAKAEAEKQQQAVEQPKPQPVPQAQPKIYHVRFETDVTMEQAKQLRMFCDSIGITLTQIK